MKGNLKVRITEYTLSPKKISVGPRRGWL